MTVSDEGPGAGSVPLTDPGDHLEAHELAEASLGSLGQEELLPGGGPMRRILKALGIAEQAIGASLIIIILALVLLQVAQRYLPGGGWAWTGEVSRLALVWCSFILSGYLLSRDQHITIKVIDYVLPPRVLGVVKLVGHLIVGATSVAMALALYRLIADDIGQRTPAAGIPLTLSYVLPMAGFVFTAMRAVLVIRLVDIPEISERGEGDAA